jgi:hypothetical protein
MQKLQIDTSTSKECEGHRFNILNVGFGCLGLSENISDILAGVLARAPRLLRP